MIILLVIFAGIALKLEFLCYENVGLNGFKFGTLSLTGKSFNA